MKSFFKKLSLVLVAAMVITMIPAQSAKAADQSVIVTTFGTAKTAVKDSYEVEVGKDLKMGVYNVPNTAAYKAAVKTWKSSDETVLKLKGGQVFTAVKAGSAKVSFTVTVDGKVYSGSTDIIVKAAAAVVTAAPTAAPASAIDQTTYNTVEIKFATDAAATAAKTGLVVNLVRKTGKREFTIKMNVQPTVSGKVVTVSGLQDKCTYRFSAAGMATEDYTMSIGPAHHIELFYPIAYVSSEQGKKDLLGNPVTTAQVQPTAKIVDIDGKVVQLNHDQIQYKFVNQPNGSYASMGGRGTVTIRRVDANVAVKATFNQTVNTTKIDVASAECPITVLPYVEDDIQGFIAAITLTPNNKTGKDIDWTKGQLPANGPVVAEINVGDEYRIAYYFEGSKDGTKYTGSNVSSTAACTESGKEVKTLSATAFKFYFRKADSNDDSISIREYNNVATVKGWVSNGNSANGGSDIYLYKQEGTTANTDTDPIYGVIRVKVKDEPVVQLVNINESYVEGLTTGLKKTQEIAYSLEDQYGNPIKATIQAKDKDGNLITANWLTITPTDPVNGKAEKGKIKIDFEALAAAEGVTKVENKEINISIKNMENSPAHQLFVNAAPIDTANGVKGYRLEAKCDTVNFGNLQDATKIRAIGANFNVITTYDDKDYEYADFAVVSDNDMWQITPAQADKLYVVITKEGTVVNKDAQNVPIATSGGSVTWATNVFFDSYNQLATSFAEQFKAGNYVATLYQTAGTSQGDMNLLMTKEFAVAANIPTLTVDAVYKLKVDDNKKPVSDKTQAINFGTFADVNTDDEVRSTVVSLLRAIDVWYDKDGNGEAVKDTSNAALNEIMSMGSLPRLEFADLKYQAGAKANGTVKEIFINYAVIRFSTFNDASAPVIEQKIVLNKKFVIAQ